jgi:hypothetical protein
LTVALTAFALATRTFTVAVLPARTTYCFDPSFCFPRTTWTVPRHTAPSSPAQLTRTETVRFPRTRSVLADLSFALARGVRVLV